jgi:pimeloyl-ACP methyl ester carboxylesterase
MRALALIFSLLFLCGARAQQVFRITWPTTHAAPPASFPDTSSQMMEGIRLSLSLFSESNVVDMVADRYNLLGISADEAGRLRELFGKRYQLIENDPVFGNVDSALSYCYSADTPDHGFALVYSPKKLTPGTQALVFLHGYGGSFLWSQHLLAEAFPNDLIICPAYGISSASMPSAYLSECLAAVGKRVGRAVQQPVLIGFSMGGFGAARIFTQSPGRFSRLIVLAAYPPQDTFARFDKNMSARFLAGTKEAYVQSGLFNRYMQSLRPRLRDIEFQTIPGADSFFLLEKKEESLRILRSWLEKPASTAAAAKKQS